jgi:IS1 family transposase
MRGSASAWIAPYYAVPCHRCREGGSRRGAPRRLATQGHACRNSPLGTMASSMHRPMLWSPLVAKAVATTSSNKISARCGTALSHLKTPPTRIGEVLSSLAEGLDVGAAVRVFGHGEAIITRWRDRAARHAERVHRHFLCGPPLPHLQLDAIRTRPPARERIAWLWLALDPHTKLIPAVALGPRTQHTAHTLVHSLREALAPTCIPVVTTDGLRLYFYAITAHVGRWIDTRRRRRWQVHPALRIPPTALAVSAAPACPHQVPHAGTRRTLRATLLRLGWSGKLQSAFVERVNLTVRQSVAALTRRPWATAQTAAGLRAQIAWWRGY